MFKKMTYAEVQDKLSAVHYTIARQYYYQKKNEFLGQYTKSLKEDQQQFSKDYVDKFVNEINTGSFHREAFNLSNKLVEILNTALINALDSNPSEIKELEQICKDNANKLTEKGRQVLLQKLKESFGLDNLQQVIEDNLQEFKKMTGGGVSPTDILSWSHSYLVRAYYNRILEKKTNVNNAQLAGYFEEALVHKATMRLTEHLKNKTAVFHTGSIKMNYNNKTIDTVFDEYINFASDNLEKSFRESINMEERTLNQGFGFQVKLRNAPWMVKSPSKWYPISSNAALFGLWQNKRSWIEGIYFLEKNMTKIFGDNVAYILGNNFYWTADMIRRFREMGYYVAFHYTKQGFSSSAGWESIDMSKPYPKTKKN